MPVDHDPDQHADTEGEGRREDAPMSVDYAAVLDGIASKLERIGPGRIVVYAKGGAQEPEIGSASLSTDLRFAAAKLRRLRARGEGGEAEREIGRRAWNSRSIIIRALDYAASQRTDHLPDDVALAMKRVAERMDEAFRNRKENRMTTDIQWLTSRVLENLPAYLRRYCSEMTDELLRVDPDYQETHEHLRSDRRDEPILKAADKIEREVDDLLRGADTGRNGVPALARQNILDHDEAMRADRERLMEALRRIADGELDGTEVVDRLRSARAIARDLLDEMEGGVETFETTDEPFPGTRKARAEGCTCELGIDPGIDLLNAFVDDDCPMHGEA